MATREAITRLTRQIFGTLPNKNISTGHQLLKKRHTAILDARYYIDSIESAARMATPGYKSELELRRSEKLDSLRRRGKGPPKKGAGKRATKKK